MIAEEKHLDVLQNIEFEIKGQYLRSGDLSDYDVLRVLECLIANYTAEKYGRPGKCSKFSPREQELMDEVHRICEWRLGRVSFRDPDRDDQHEDPAQKTVDEMLLCLKRILKSIHRWNKLGGRQGYLRFIAEHVV
ncbi:MAG: hypothetical protein HYV26_16045 [Candidatus Hydrogenedentes bacterium]|nr:hypothetical protein [Candidatus Hydrogenedentota bacterium]MBI3117145.1 hypothetical protein [Candidatus Hydrogenedentota bacterium]